MSSRTSRWIWAGAAIGAIWLCLAAMAIWSPPLISGSAQEHLPLTAITGWVWALLATGLVVMAPAVTTSDLARVWTVYAAAVALIWIAAAAVSIAAPPMVTGTDPTSIPLAGIVAPVVALVATAYATVAVVAIGARGETLGGQIDAAVRRITEPVPRSVG
jgi:hypothetical protein